MITRLTMALLACICLYPLPSVVARPGAMLLHCYPVVASTIARGLERSHNEERRVVARAASGRALVEIYVAAETGTWTLILRNTDGTACMLMAGDGWQELEAMGPARGINQ